MKITYSSNNSGGGWWLSTEDWLNLEKAGWLVDWRPEGEWLGAKATSASIEANTMENAIGLWERVTGQDSNDPGCSCCGQPHNFYEPYEEGPRPPRPDRSVILMEN